MWVFGGCDYDDTDNCWINIVECAQCGAVETYKSYPNEIEMSSSLTLV